ncbi:hypothetical protein O987_17067 [Comamonas testosteroni TK102]|uniref:Uncharacterized protein n=1 Tax=Comamonas testosteroni TK102 TaxID=1392005 RepID=A0A076PS78_COMTE|nr:hypothetical protein O987_17067 [Comamonas testosteroni TK102]
MLNVDWLFGIVIDLRGVRRCHAGKAANVRVWPKATTAQEPQKTSILALAGAIAAQVPSGRFR